MLRSNQHSFTRRIFKLGNNLNPAINIIIVIILLLVSFFLIAKFFSVSTRQYQIYRDNLIELQQLDAEFNQIILKARYELFTTYDPLVSNLAKQQSLQAKLINVPDFIDSEAKKDLETILDETNTLLEQKASLSESFKSRNALLKNSLRYLPLLTNQLENKFEASEIAKIITPTQLATLRGNLNKLIRNLLLYNIAVDEKTQSEIESLKAQVSQLKIEYGLTEDEFPAGLVESHTNIILNTKPQVEQLTALLITPLKKETQALESLLENNYRKAVITNNIYRFLAICWFIGLLGLLNYILLKRLQTSNPQLLQYQQKVKRITAALTQALAVKQNLSVVANNPPITDLTSCRNDLGVLATLVIQVTEQLKQEQEINLQEESFAFLAARLSLLTKNSQKVLNPQILARLKSILEDVLQSRDCQFIDLKGKAEQIQLLFRYPPKIKLSQLVKEIKTVSSFALKEEFSAIEKNVDRDGEFWSDAYFIASCDGNFLNKKSS